MKRSDMFFRAVTLSCVFACSMQSLAEQAASTENAKWRLLPSADENAWQANLEYNEPLPGFDPRNRDEPSWGSGTRLMNGRAER
jgi:hypothetical protein